jgi:hypothetical protein
MNRKLGVLAIAAAVLAVACTDPAGPSARTLQLDTPSAALNPIAGYPFPSSNGLPRTDPNDGDGHVRLCKVSDVSGTFNFDVAVNAAVDGISDISITVAEGQVNTRVCRSTPLFNSDLPANLVDVVNIVEADPGPNTAVTIDIDQYFVNGVPYHASALADEWNVSPRTAKVYINDDLEKVVVFNNDFTAPGGQGCTPGYWKQAHHFDSWPAGYTTGMSLNSALGLPGTALWPNSLTLLQALSQGGGGAAALGRHAAAAILNAASGFYPLTVAQVQAAVLVAYNNASQIEAQKNLLAGNNELGCPLN